MLSKSSQIWLKKRNATLRSIYLFYKHDDGVEHNYQKALTYYQDAAKGHNMVAYYNIVLIYYY
jgi:TPR repeat protein